MTSTDVQNSSFFRRTQAEYIRPTTHNTLKTRIRVAFAPEHFGFMARHQ